MKAGKNKSAATAHLAFGSIAKPRPKTINKRRRGGIAGIIFIGSFAGLLVLVIGSLVFNELRTGLTQARADTLKAQGMTIASVLGEVAVIGEPEPYLDDERARIVLRRLFREPNARMRLFSVKREVVADSNDLNDEIDERELPAIGPSVPDIGKAAKETVENARIMVQGELFNQRKALQTELDKSLAGEITTSERFDENGERVISVSVPIQRVRAVVGVLTLESADVSQIIKRERLALVPFIIVAIFVNLIYAAVLAWLIAKPLRRLSLAADEVSSGTRHTLNEEDLVNRPDEIGELAESLSSMTSNLQERIDANESFAADVAHEIKNPLAAVRSATELLRGQLKPEQKDKLEKMVSYDLGRIDRLVTDISNASRLDAELARANPDIISFAKMVNNLGQTYASLTHARNIEIDCSITPKKDPVWVFAREDALSRVIINLLENAISFAPDNSKIKLRLNADGKTANFTIEDEGGGIPDEALEKVFERFYTHRPKENAAFGNHSGLGLAIAKQIIESSDGKLWAENIFKDDKKIGARFCINLPNNNRI